MSFSKWPIVPQPASSKLSHGIKKHAHYGYKVEVSVTQTGFAIGCTKHFGGETADIDIFRNNISFHEKFMKKKGNETQVQDSGQLSEQYSDQWLVLADKGYQGLSRTHRVLTPLKKPPSTSQRFLTRSDRKFNKKISSDRVIVENFFGRMQTL